MDKNKKETTENRRMANITGNIGLYYACYRLSLLGLNVMPTARNTKGVDIIVYNRECTNIAGIQVKTRAKKTGLRICLRKEENPADKVLGEFWVVVPIFSGVPETSGKFKTAGGSLQFPGDELSVKFAPAIVVPTSSIRKSIKKDSGGLVVKDTKESGSWWLSNEVWWPSKKDQANFDRYAEYREAWHLIKEQLS